MFKCNIQISGYATLLVDADSFEDAEAIATEAFSRDFASPRMERLKVNEKVTITDVHFVQEAFMDADDRDADVEGEG